MPARIEAGGGVLWRGDPARPEVAVVHRPRYDDWSLPKGKLHRGEHPLLGALREIEEETGFTARAGRRLASLRYDVAEGPKRVRYWECEVTSGAFAPNREVDELRWEPVPAALQRLAPDHDRAILESFAADTRRTHALVVVRHASAGDKRRWDGADAERPLDPAGRSRSRTVAALLSAYGVTRAGTADVRRCRETLSPWARATGTAVETLKATTAGTFPDDPEEGVDQVAALVEGQTSAVWCGQREVIPDLLAGLGERLGGASRTAGLLAPAKGVLLVLRLDEQGRLVTLERSPG